MAMSRFLLTLLLFTISTYAYWGVFSGSGGPTHITAKRSDDMFTFGGPWTYETWTIEAGDKFIPMEFIGSSPTAAFTLFIKPGQKWMLAWIDIDGEWRYQAKGDDKIGAWPTSADDQYVSGHFVSYHKELLISNPDGRYATYKLDVITTGTLPNFNYNFEFVQLQYATNGDVGADDVLISGNFDTSISPRRDYVVLIKKSGHYVMKFNTITFNWDILSSSSNGRIYWWIINTSSDKYVVGGFKGYQEDQLLCINPNGWHHMMEFNTVTKEFQYIAGGSNGKIGNTWTLGPNNRFIAGHFNHTYLSNSNTNHLLALDPNGNSQTFSFKYNNWVLVDTNNGDSYIAGWQIGWNDHVTRVESKNPGHYNVLMFNNGGWWKSMHLDI